MLYICIAQKIKQCLAQGHMQKGSFGALVLHLLF